MGRRIQGLRIVHADVVGSSEPLAGPRLAEQPGVPAELWQAINKLYGADVRLTPPQTQAFAAGFLERRLDLLVSAPTNSGKTLIPLLKMFTAALTNGARSVYVAPLKALAEEKLVDFTRLAEAIREFGGPRINVSISTGDYP